MLPRKLSLSTGRHILYVLPRKLSLCISQVQVILVFYMLPGKLSLSMHILYASREVESVLKTALLPLSPPLSHSLFLSLTLSFFSFHSLSLLWILFGPLRHRDSRQNCNGGTYTSHVPKKTK